jgi:ketosteroid isomerase-like protein
MDLKEIADTLVAGCRGGKPEDNLDRLYAPDAVSVEATDMGGGRETSGVEGIRGKHAWWAESFEMHDGSVSDPMLHGPDRFAVIFEMDVTEKATGTRSQMKEVALYTVGDGRILREEFFY